MATTETKTPRVKRELKDSVVLITGALTGIGRATALAFADEGSTVVIAGRREEAGKLLEAELQAKGVQAAFIKTDVRFEKEVESLVDQTVARFGRIDVAVNNAGVEGTPGPILDQTAESYAATFDTNVLGIVLSLKHELRVMIPNGHGSVINVSSSYGSMGAAYASIYVGSKHAVEGITKSVALEVATTGVRVNVVAPGTTETGMLERFTGTKENYAGLISTVPMGRVGQPDEIAAAIVFLGSDKAPYLTGTSIGVDGGLLA
ncbi:SDR family NAD(P)-dependent oxidoreductase [Mucilaginibacter sp.]|uniref:SDR family NAD(P)-dependent oxidoreductase n=1 Tax=Mucilaginibacter sp. TaxID=1882438 RepID=UPI002611D052|nr:glucose 1-dehydrogenase [Mucilaginibacter sp.]MDB4923013.1 short-chain dehydrogenase/reductase [Mucilaginibacter sp.]